MLTDLPMVTATGRNGSTRPAISTVAPMRACDRNSLAMRRIVCAGTSHTSAAHSGVRRATWAISFACAGIASTPWWCHSCSSAPTSTASTG